MALLDQRQMESISPFFATGLGKVAGRCLKRLLNLNRFCDYYERSAAGGVHGPDFARNVLTQTGASYEVAGLDVLEGLEPPFITISNHPYGGLDGIILVDLIGHIFPDYKVLVNKFLSYLEAMGPSFITVTPTGTERTAPTRDSISGIRTALQHLREGHPLGIFPSGAVSDLDRKTGLVTDRPWQEAIIRVIRKAGVPVVPVRFFDGNSKFYYRLGLIDWKVRLMRLPTEVINKAGTQNRLAFGPVIQPEVIRSFQDIPTLTGFLRSSVYDMSLPPRFTSSKDLER